MEERETFSPSGGNVGEGQRIEATSSTLLATMGDQICFEKTGLSLIPVLKGADWDLVFQERPRACRRNTAKYQSSFSLRRQQAIRRCRTHGEQLVPTFFGDVQMFMPLQRFDQCREKRHEPLGTDAIRCAPCQEQRVLHVWSRLGVGVDAEEGTASPSDGSGATLHIYERILWLPQWASRRAPFCEAEASRYRGTICWSNSRLA